MKKTTEVFNFNDGNGAVPAHRHINLDGSVGGWVANTAQVYGNAQVYDNAWVYGNARVCGNARVYGDAWVCGNAQVCDNAQVYGNARVSSNAHVLQTMKVQFSTVTTDLANRNNIIENIKAQTGLMVFNNEIVCYKQVRPDLKAHFDNKFQYIVGKYAEATYIDRSDTSCSAGLHFSNATYWERSCREDSVYLMCRVSLDDIITVQEGKIRASKCFVMACSSTARS